MNSIIGLAIEAHLKASLKFRSVQSNGLTLPETSNPFLIRESTFNIGPGQIVPIQVSFRPMSGGKYTASLEILVKFRKPLKNSWL